MLGSGRKVLAAEPARIVLHCSQGLECSVVSRKPAFMAVYSSTAEVVWHVATCSCIAYSVLLFCLFVSVVCSCPPGHDGQFCESRIRYLLGVSIRRAGKTELAWEGLSRLSWITAGTFASSAL